MKRYILVLFAVFFVFKIYSQEKNLNLIIGTYTNSCASNGIYVYNFDVQTGDTKLKSSSEKALTQVI